jgi:hypothetical protein
MKQPITTYTPGERAIHLNSCQKMPPLLSATCAQGMRWNPSVAFRFGWQQTAQYRISGRDQTDETADRPFSAKVSTSCANTILYTPPHVLKLVHSYKGLQQTPRI